jgi:hypothetical protein
MKKIVLASFYLLLIIINAAAQPGRGNSKFDAATNPYEKILKDTAAGKRTARFVVNFLQPEVLRDYFNASPCNEYAEVSNTRMTQFNEFVQQFLSGSSDPKQMEKAEEDFKKKGTASFSADMDYHIGFIEKQGTFASDANQPLENLICRAKGSVQAIKSMVIYLEAVKKVYPSVTGIDEVIEKGKQALSNYPDNKSLLAVIKKNKNGELADVTFPAATAKNAEWEGWFKNYFSKAFPGYTIVRNHLQSDKWYAKNNAISGLPEYRQIGTKIGAKGPDGKCYIFTIDIFQDYLGGKFTESRFENNGKQEMLCENLK